MQRVSHFVIHLEDVGQRLSLFRTYFFSFKKQNQNNVVRLI
jgi:hypothetical protein